MEIRRRGEKTGKIEPTGNVNSLPSKNVVQSDESIARNEMGGGEKKSLKSYNINHRKSTSRKTAAHRQ